MPILTPCPHCQKRFRAPDTLAGKSVKCPGCQGVVRVPAAEGPAGSPQTPSQPASASASWYILTENREQMGPVTKEQLDNLATKGRLSFCQIRRSDWRAWKWADDLYPDLPAPDRKADSAAPAASGDDQDPARLVLCPDCGNTVSRRATGCPHCGCPFQEVPATKKQTIKETRAIRRGNPLQWLTLGLVDGLVYFPVLLATSLLVGLLSSLAAILAGIGQFVVFGPLLCGFWAVVVAIARRKDTNPGKLFDGFLVFRHAVGLTFLVLAYGMIGLGCLAIVGFLIVKTFNYAHLSVALVSTFLYLLAFYMWFRINFAYILLIDQNFDVGKAVRTSLRLTGDRDAHVFLLLAIAYSVLLIASFAGILLMLLSLFGISDDATHLIVLTISGSILGCIWFAAITMPAGHFYADRVREFDTDVSAYTPPENSRVRAILVTAILIIPVVVAPIWFLSSPKQKIADQLTQSNVATIASEPEPIPEPEEPGEEVLSAEGKSQCIDEASQKMAQYIDEFQLQYHLPLSMLSQTAESVEMLKNLAGGNLDAIPDSTGVVPGGTGIEPYKSQANELFVECRDWVRKNVKRGPCTATDVWKTAREWTEQKRQAVLQPIGGVPPEDLTPAPIPEGP